MFPYFFQTLSSHFPQSRKDYKTSKHFSLQPNGVKKEAQQKMSDFFGLGETAMQI